MAHRADGLNDIYDNDLTVKGKLTTTTGIIHTTPTADSDIVNKKYVDDEILNQIEDGTASGQMAFWDGSKWVKTETNELFWDDTNKRVGIGTTSPSYKLEVNGGNVGFFEDDSIANNANGNILKIWRNASEGKDAIQFLIDQYRNAFIYSNAGILFRSENSQGIIFDGLAGDIRFRDDTYQDYVTFKRVTGNVGIGTTSPDTKLQVVGNTKFGDDNTNYASFATDGELTLTGTARTINNIWIPADGLKAPGAKPATYISHGIDGAWQFADEIEINQETISGRMHVPFRMDRTVAPTFCIGWSADGESPGNCEWQLEYLWSSPNEDTTAAAQETLTLTSTASATSNGLVMGEVTGIDLPSATDTCLQFRITRLSAHANDTITDTVELLGITLKFTRSKLGTAL